LGERIYLGMSFIEINGRAYVKSVQPHSQAARAGVLPRDSIQFASLYHTDFDDTEDFDVSSDLDESATSFALACEARGMRISYDELRRLLAEGLDPAMQSNRHFCRHRPMKEDGRDRPFQPRLIFVLRKKMNF